jgi:UDP-3-O-[3-hydroxymyristoyl] glucosamine N-acyltransferase
MPYTALQIADLIGGTVIGDGNVTLSGFAPAGSAKPGDLTFAENDVYFARAEQSAASAVLVDGPFTSCKPLIKVSNARVGFARAMSLFFPEPAFNPGIHPSAVVAPTALIDPAAPVGPLCVVGERARIGARVVLQANNFVGDSVQIGESCMLYAGVTLYAGTQLGKRVRIHAGTVIGSDGFGYVFDSGIHRKVPQVGNVIVHDDVEIGANVTIDRGALGPTVIGKGTKIDNLVQIAHNVTIGEHCLVVAQAGIAGSTRLGNYVTLAGQVGIAGHLKIGNGATIAAQSGVMHDVPDGQKWFGSPAMPDRKMKRQVLATQQLPELLRRVAELERTTRQWGGITALSFAAGSSSAFPRNSRYTRAMLVVHVHVRVKPGFIEAFKAATLVNAQASRQEAGIARFDLLQSTDDPSRFLLVEAYRNAEAPAAHKDTAHYKTWRDAVAEMMAEPRQSTKFTNIDPPDNSY